MSTSFPFSLPSPFSFEVFLLNVTIFFWGGKSRFIQPPFHLFLFLEFSNSGWKEIVVVGYASERRRHKGKSFSHIGRRGGHQSSRVDFCKSNRSRVVQWYDWNLGNWRARRNNQQPSHQTIQTRRRRRRRESKDLTIFQLSYHFLLFICWRIYLTRCGKRYWGIHTET